MEEELTPVESARVEAAYYAAARLVWSELCADDGLGDKAGRSAREWEAALADFVTDDEEENWRRTDVLIEALVEYAAFNMRRADGEEALEHATRQVWAKAPMTPAELVAAELQKDEQKV